MITLAFSVRDRAINAFDRPFFAPTEDAAKRAFSDEVNREGAPMNSHPEDYDLFLLGTYDDSTGRLAPVDPQQIAVGKSVLRK